MLTEAMKALVAAAKAAADELDSAAGAGFPIDLSIVERLDAAIEAAEKETVTP